MIIYDKEGLHNSKVFSEASAAYRKDLITEAELSRIKYAYASPFYTPNFFVRIGFFILTCIISGMGCGLISMMFTETGIIVSYGWFIFLGILNYATLEFLIKQNHYYRAGVDDALIWISGGLITATFMEIVDQDINAGSILISGFILLLALTYTLRFTYVLAAVVAYLAAFVLVFFSWQKLGNIGIMTMPFVLIAFSGFTQWMSKKGEASPKTYCYHESLVAVQLVSLLTLYLSGNYYAVKELGDMLNETSSKTIPLAWFFWLWTIALPFAYIVFGVRQKSILLIRTGLILIAAAIYTFRNYYHVLPLEQAITAAGIVIVGVSWFLVRYLRQPKAGFTSQAEGAGKKEDEFNVESLIVSETFSGVGSHTSKTETFGDGRFGGGGSSSSY